MVVSVRGKKQRALSWQTNGLKLSNSKIFYDKVRKNNIWFDWLRDLPLIQKETIPTKSFLTNS